MAFVRLNGSEDFGHIKPLTLAPRELTAIAVEKYEVMKSLYSHRVIVIHEDSDPEAFDIKEDGSINFYLDRVTYAISGSGPVQRQNLVLKLEQIFRSQEWPAHWYEEQVPLWKKLVVDEALAYMTIVLKEHGFDFSPGEKTIAMVTNLFEDYSLGQVYNLMWRSAKDAASYYLREKITKQHATNIAVSGLQRQAERAKAEGWQVKNYRRDFRCPEPMVSEVFFNTVLQIGTAGFDTKPFKWLDNTNQDEQA